MSSQKKDSYEFKCFFHGDHYQSQKERGYDRQPRRQLRSQGNNKINLEKDKRFIIRKWNNERPQSVEVDARKLQLRSCGSQPSINSLSGANSKSSWCHLVRRKLSRREWDTGTIYSIESSVVVESDSGIKMPKCKDHKCTTTRPEYKQEEEICEAQPKDDNVVLPSMMGFPRSTQQLGEKESTLGEPTRLWSVNFSPRPASTSGKSDKGTQSEPSTSADAGSQLRSPPPETGNKRVSSGGLFVDAAETLSGENDDEDYGISGHRTNKGSNDLKLLMKLESLQSTKRFEILIKELTQVKQDVREMKGLMQNTTPSAPPAGLTPSAPPAGITPSAPPAGLTPSAPPAEFIPSAPSAQRKKKSFFRRGK